MMNVEPEFAGCVLEAEPWRASNSSRARDIRALQNGEEMGLRIPSDFPSTSEVKQVIFVYFKLGCHKLTQLIEEKKLGLN